MCLSAFKGLRKAFPDAELVFFNHQDYWQVLERCPDLDRWVHTTSNDRRRPRRAPLDPARFPYLNNEPGPWFAEYDLWCPAWVHEHDAGHHAVTQSRVQSFAMEAGVWSLICDDPRPRLRPTPEDHEAADRWLERYGLDPHRVIGWQPFPTDTSRKWPEERIMEAAEVFEGMGFQNVFFDCVSKRVRNLLPIGTPCASLRLGIVAAILARIRLCISPDSSFTHLCGADGVDCLHLGLYGKTAGELWESPYPRGNWLQGNAVDCNAPCWHRHGRGHDTSWCRPHGCSALLNISVDHVVEAVRALLMGQRVGWHVEGGFDGEVREGRVARAETPPKGRAKPDAGERPKRMRGPQGLTSPGEAPDVGLPQQLDLLKDDWKALLVFDACRGDMFKEATGGQGEVVWGPAGHTSQWCEAIWPVLKDRQPIIVTANPIPSIAKERGQHNFDLVPLVNDHATYCSADWIPAVHPRDVCALVRGMVLDGTLGPGRPFIVWFTQPHAPYIGDQRLRGDRVQAGTFQQMVRRFMYMPRLYSEFVRGEITAEEVRVAYGSNLDLVWRCASQLGEWLATRLKGAVHVTGDHGELLGEDCLLGHQDSWDQHPVLHKVPWFTFEGVFSPPSMLDVLRALGYAD
jgi:hypothetical protein